MNDTSCNDIPALEVLFMHVIVICLMHLRLTIWGAKTIFSCATRIMGPQYRNPYTQEVATSCKDTRLPVQGPAAVITTV